MPRIWVWLQLVIGWLPVWALYSTLLFFAHPGTPTDSAIFAGFRAIMGAALLGLVVHRLTQRYRWPIPMRLGFIAWQLVAASVFSMSWIIMTSVIEMAFRAGHGGGSGQFLARVPLVPFLVLGIWMYVMVAGISYAMQAAQRAAHAESLVARTQLAALRSQLNPHFLFNALHTVVQLIPGKPHQAAQAAERLAGLLRTSLEEDRDLIPLADEGAFVARYVELEQIRFGDRLRVELRLDGDAADALVPSFALQTLVENAVRHGAAPRVESTTVHVFARVEGDRLIVDVQDDGAGADPAHAHGGTGLTRLRERLGAIFGERATLSVHSTPGSGFLATMTTPYRDGSLR